jgi:signal peptidase I
VSGSDQDDSYGARDRGQVYRSDTGSWKAVRPADPGAHQDGQPAGDDAPGAAATDRSPNDESPVSTTAPAAGGRRTQGQKGKRSFWRELPILIVIALVLAVLIKTFAIQAFWIPSGSMENTLEINDRVLVNKMVYHFRPIHRGDIVVFNGDGSWDPGTVPVPGNVFEQFYDGFASMFGFGKSGDILIKRVIGIPGDHVVCCNARGQITVNGVPLSEQSYLYPGSEPSEIKFNIVVPSGRLWVMGDNRLVSADSRDHQGDPGGGTIPESAVVGRAFVIIWPPSRWRILPIPATFQQPALNASSAASSPGAASVSGSDVLSARLEPSSPALPLALGFAGALPLTWMQRRVRLRVTRHRARRPSAGGGQASPSAGGGQVSAGAPGGQRPVT